MSRQAGTSHGANSGVVPSVRRTGRRFLADSVLPCRCDARIHSPSPGQSRLRHSTATCAGHRRL